jgi:transposase
MSTEPENLFNDPSLPNQSGKRRKAKSAPVFKSYQQHQMMLLPPSLEEMIPEKHLVRVVNQTIDELNVDALLETYKGGGASAYHPKMMLKVLIYAYLSKIYSSRQIAKALRQDINFMWISGMQQPEFSIINHFRSSRLKEVVDQVFGSMVFFLLDHGYIDLNQYFVDGTKLRADSNKHKVVWAKNTRRYKEKVQQKINELLREIERTNTQEQDRYGDRDLEELGEHTTLTSEGVKEQVDTLNKIVEHTAPSKHASKVMKEIETKLLPKLEKYEQQEETLAGRNSYARTDPDATVFRTRDDQLIPAYNLLVGTQNQFIVNYSFHQQKASESDGLPAHLERMYSLLGRYPKLMMGDSGYGSEENYALLKDKNIGNYLKYNTFHPEQTKKYKSNPYRKENFPHDAATDTYTCPQGRSLVFKEERWRLTDNGYRFSFRLYQSQDCTGCPVASECKRSKGPRSIQVNPTLDAYRAQARQNLNSELGIALRKRRGVDVEPPFGDIKFNQGYNRCRLRGQAKVNVEIGLLSIAHNTKKIARWVN